MSIIGTGAGGGAVTLVNRMPTPSIMPNKIPPKAADFMADRNPVRSWRTPPVNAAAAMLFHGSSAVHECESNTHWVTIYESRWTWRALMKTRLYIVPRTLLPKRYQGTIKCRK